MRLLRALGLRLVVARLLERVGSAELASDHVARLPQGALRHVERVGPHIGDEADRYLAQRHAFVELLRKDHRPLHRIAKLA